MALGDVGGALGRASNARVGVQGEHRQQPVDGRLGTGVAVDRAVAGHAVERPAGRGVVHRLAGRVVAEVPGPGHACEVAERAAARGVVHGEQVLQRRVGAIGDLGAVHRRWQPAVFRAGAHEQVGCEARGLADGSLAPGRTLPRRRHATAIDRGSPRQRSRHLVAPGVPVRARPGPRHERPERPLPRVAQWHGRDPVGELPQRAPPLTRPPGLGVRAQPVHRLRGRVRTVGDEPRRPAQPIRTHVLAVRRAQHLAVHRAEGQLQPPPQEAREVRVVVGECRVPLTQRPDRPRQPVAVTGVGRVRQLDWFRGWVERSVRLHPQHDVAAVRAGVGLQVGQPAQQLVGVLAARGLAGGTPVPQVHDRSARDVVGVERALRVRVGLGVVGAAADALVAAVLARLGIGPQHADSGLGAEAVGRVPGLGRRVHGVAEEVEVVEVRQRLRPTLHR